VKFRGVNSHHSAVGMFAETNCLQPMRLQKMGQRMQLDTEHSNAGIIV
jgi:hypothetical protein